MDEVGAMLQMYKEKIQPSFWVDQYVPDEIRMFVFWK